MEQRISLVTLGVSDLVRERAFYEALGWGGAQQPDDEVCFFQAGGMVFGLWTGLGGHGAPGIELAYNVRSEDEVTVILSQAEKAGGTIVRAAERAEWGGITGALTSMYLGGAVTILTIAGGLFYTFQKQKGGLHSKTRHKGVFVHPVHFQSYGIPSEKLL